MRVPRVTPLAGMALLGVLTLTLASACGSSSSSPAASSTKLEKTNLVVGATAAEAVTPLYVASQRGIFKAHGLKVTIQTITSTADIVPDLLHGTLDVAAGQLTTFIAAQSEGLGPFHVLASGLSLGPKVNEIVTLKSSGITSAAGLKGKTIAVNASSGNGVLLTDSLLAANGISPSDVTLKVLPFTAMSAALAAHQVDAVYATQPYVTEMEQQLGATVVADLDQGTAKNYMVGGFTVTSSWLKKNPNTAAAFSASIAQASQVANTNRAADAKAFEQYLGASPKVADVMATGTFPATVQNARLQQLANLMLQFGELKAHFNVAVLSK
jgi:NitT/TauT family transport system substrate-binding protein